MNYEMIISGLLGIAIGDAMGVPVEFEAYEKRRRRPVTGYEGGGTHGEAPGTWSDDTCMTLACADSLSRGLSYSDMMACFLGWFEHGQYSATGRAFGVGRGTLLALGRARGGTEPTMCGGTSERDNGNGAIMRILPLAFYLVDKGFSIIGSSIDISECFNIIENVTALTHRHPRAQIASAIYVITAMALSEGMDIEQAIKSGVNLTFQHYKNDEKFSAELDHFCRMQDESLFVLHSDELRTSGYVVDTLESAYWVLYHARCFSEVILKCVNLGGDTDTIAAVAGGLAGIHYGIIQISREWVEGLVNLDLLLSIGMRLSGPRLVANTGL